MLNTFRNSINSNSSYWIVLCDDSHWQVAKVTPHEVKQAAPIDHDANSIVDDTVVKALHAELINLGYNSEPILLALGSSWCVAVRSTLTSADTGKKREAWTYVFESFTPWSAEELTFDYEIVDSSILMAGVETDFWLSLVRSLETFKIRVESISPIARLAVQFYVKSASGMPERYLFLWRHEKSTELWRIERGNPVDWQWLSDEEHSVSRAIGASLLNEPTALPVFGIGLSEKEKSVLQTITQGQYRDNPVIDITDLAEAGFREAAAVLAGKRKASIEFRRGELIVGDRYRSLRIYLIAVKVALILTLATLAIALWIRTESLDRQDLEARQKQADLFGRIFPQRKVPVGVRSQLNSELVRLQGLRGLSDAIPKSAESAEILQRALRSLPVDMRLRISEAKIEDGRINLYGQVREHSDASRIVAELIKNGFDSSPPFTRRLKDLGFEFRISATSQDANSTREQGGS